MDTKPTVIKKTIYKDFLTTLLEERNNLWYIGKITNGFSNKVLYRKETDDNVMVENAFCLYQDVPSYLQTHTDPFQKNLKLKKSTRYNGFLINLTKHKTIDEYLNHNFSKTSRSRFRKYQKRLNHSFDITYKMYYGEIAKEEYDYLFNEFRHMLEKRFLQKKAENEELQRWNQYCKTTYPLILEKKACLFVIYNGKKPIDICLNFIYDKIVFSYISGFDVDFSKYNIGFIDMLKHLEWCYEQGFEIFDLLKGEYDYKSRWSNETYHYETQIIYDSHSFKTRLKATLKSFKIKKYFQLIHFLKKHKVHLLYRKAKTLIFVLKKPTAKLEEMHYVTLEENRSFETEHGLKKIDISDLEYTHLKKPVYDFLYKNFDHIGNIKVYSYMDVDGQYLIEGSKENQKIKLNQ